MPQPWNSGETRASLSAGVGGSFAWLHFASLRILVDDFAVASSPFLCVGTIAYSSVPIFLPKWWPHSWYNTRYGVELLPAFALSLGFRGQFFLSRCRPRLQAAMGPNMPRTLVAFAIWNNEEGNQPKNLSPSSKAPKHRVAPTLRATNTAAVAHALGSASRRTGTDEDIHLSGRSTRIAHRNSAAPDDQ